MTIKELLEECREEMHTALIIQRRREELALSLLPHGRTIHQIQIHGYKHAEDPLSEYAAEACEMDRKLARQQERILRKQQIADMYISTLKKERHKQILGIYYMTFCIYNRTMTYPSGKTKTVRVRGLHSWQTTAQEIGVDEKTIYRDLQALNKKFMKKGVNVSMKL